MFYRISDRIVAGALPSRAGHGKPAELEARQSEACCLANSIEEFFFQKENNRTG